MMLALNLSIGVIPAKAGTRPSVSMSINRRLAWVPASAGMTARGVAALREELAAMGIALKDTKNKETGEIEATWEVAR